MDRKAHDDVMCTVFISVRGIPSSTEKLLLSVIPYHLIVNALKCFKVRLPLTLLTAMLMTYFWFSGWSYTPFVLTNQNHCFMPQLNDLIIKMSLCIHYFGRMSCLIPFVYASLNCEQRENSEKFKNGNMCLHRGSHKLPPSFPACRSKARSM